MAMQSRVRARLRSEAQGIKETLEVGKGGVTDTLVAELKAQLGRRGLVKVGLRTSATHEAGRDEVAAQLAERTASELVEVRGNTAVYWRPGVARPV